LVPATTVSTFALSAAAAWNDTTAGNNIVNQTITLTNDLTAATANLTVLNDMSAANIAALVTPAVTAATGWTATATTTATFQTLQNDGNVSFTLTGSLGSANIPATAVTTTDLSALDAAINSFSASTGITSTVSGGVLTLTDATGADIKLDNFLNSGTGTVSMGGISLTSGAATDSTTVGGTVTFTGPGTTGIVNGGAAGATITTTATPATSPVGMETATTAAADTSGGNNVAAQTLTIVGPNSTQPVEIENNDSAERIAHKVNLETILTGVSAEARTTATISDLQNDGTISFTIQGSNADPLNISATVTSDDLTPLASTLNEKAGITGILATLSGDKKSITLIQAEGHDIKIGDYRHSSDLPTDTITITGNEGEGIALQGDSASTADSTVVGGEVSFYSTGSFNVQSTVEGGLGSIFNSPANVANASELTTIDTVDIGTIAGATEAIKSIDGAISQIDDLRGLLGAIQNRFESTISNLMNVSENLSAARSRILDADIAQETSLMTKNNILQQAGVSILTQANQTPQLALQLLQG
jgi:flagellin